MAKTPKIGYCTALAVVLLCAVPAHTQNLVALYEKAKAEGSVVLYAGGPTAPWDAAAKDFSARYPGVNVSITGGFSNVLDAKIDTQLKAGKPSVNLPLFQPPPDFVPWKQNRQRSHSTP